MNFNSIGSTTMIGINPIFSWRNANLSSWLDECFCLLPVLDWSRRSRQDWNGRSRWRPVGNSMSCNCFDICSKMWINCEPIGFDGIWLSSNCPIERRKRTKDQSLFSASCSNGPSLFGSRLSPGGPSKNKNKIMFSSVVMYEVIPADQLDPRREKNQVLIEQYRSLVPVHTGVPFSPLAPRGPSVPIQKKKLVWNRQWSPILPFGPCTPMTP